MKISKHLHAKAAVALCAWAIASTAGAAPPESIRGVWTILTGNAYTRDLGEYPFSANK